MRTKRYHLEAKMNSTELSSTAWSRSSLGLPLTFRILSNMNTPFGLLALLPTVLHLRSYIGSNVSSSATGTLASFPGLSRSYVRLVHPKREREEKFEKRERPGVWGFTATCRLNLVANAVRGSARVRGTANQHVCMSAGHRHGRGPSP